MLEFFTTFVCAEKDPSRRLNPKTTPSPGFHITESPFSGVALESFEGPNTAGHSVEELSIDDLFGDSLGGGKDVFYPLGTLMEMHEMGTDTSSFSEIPSSDEVKFRFFLKFKI